MLFLSLLKMKLGHMTLFLCLSGYFIGAISLRKSSQSRGFGKNLKMGMAIKGGCL